MYMLNRENPGFKWAREESEYDNFNVRKWWELPIEKVKIDHFSFEVIVHDATKWHYKHFTDLLENFANRKYHFNDSGVDRRIWEKCLWQRCWHPRPFFQGLNHYLLIKSTCSQAVALNSIERTVFVGFECARYSQKLSFNLNNFSLSMSCSLSID